MNYITLNNKNIAPSKVVCIGRNYVEHIYELNNSIPTEPVIFIKPNSAISQHIFCNKTDEIHYESEISFLINDGQLKAVGFGLDLTKRTVQSHLKKQGLPWERAKAFNQSAVFSEFVKFDGDCNRIRIELWINGVLKQSGNCSSMLFKPVEILSDIQSFLTLEDGDIIMTGTPKGVAAICENDVFIGKIYSNDRLLIEKSWVVKPCHPHKL